MTQKTVILKEVGQSEKGTPTASVQLFHTKEDAQLIMKGKADEYIKQHTPTHVETQDHMIQLKHKDGTMKSFIISEQETLTLKSDNDLFMKNKSKEDILRSYFSLESLCSSLDSCYDLHDLGYCDEITQKNYIELSELSALELWANWKQAHGREICD